MAHRSRSFVAALAASLVIAACGSADPQPSKDPPESAKASAHAPANAKPGTYEDWCDEHQVPESLCTQCNPTLVAAFKATGDWCDEHGLPESQCRVCNPDLKIERPAKTIREN